MAQSVAHPVANVTYVFTDIEGSSSITNTLEQTRPGLYEQHLRDPQRERLAQFATQHNGLEIHRAGDGHLFVFQFVEDAVAFCVRFQQSLYTTPIQYMDGGTTHEIKVRIGVHTAKGQRKPNLLPNELPEYPGSDTNYAARIGTLGVGGQIIISKETYKSAHDLRDYQLSPCGVYPWPGRFLKSFPGPHLVYEITYYDGQVPIEPGMRWFAEWYRSERNRFVDRPEKEAEVFAAMDQKSGGRLVTITGIGGTGKTRLAIACAAKRSGLYDDGVCFVSLATADLVENPDAAYTNRNVAFVAQAIGTAMGLQGEAAQPETLFQTLRTKNLLLVLDNYESVACDEIGQYLIRLATDTPGISLLVTGRKPVGVDDIEVLVDLNDGMTLDESRNLFLDRARLKDKNALPETLTPAEETQLTRILTLTERIPLALELAAARIKYYGLKQIADGLNNTALGDMGKATGLRADDTITYGRHRGVERSLLWSYNLLDAAAKDVLAACSLFADTFDETAIEATQEDVADAGRGLRTLQDASLVTRDTKQQGLAAYRFRLHRATREFAANRLAESDTASETQDRFIKYYVLFVINNKDETNDLSRLAYLDAEWRNVIAAADTAETKQDHESVIRLTQLGDFFAIRSLSFDWEKLCQKAVAAARASGDRQNEGRTLIDLANVYQYQDRWDEAIEVYQQSLSIARTFTYRLGEAQILMGLGNIYQHQDRWGEAIKFYQQSLSIYRELTDRGGEAQILNNLGSVYQYQDRWDDAIKFYQQSLSIYREFDYKLREGRTLGNLGNVYLNQKRWDEAIEVYQQSLSTYREFNDRIGEAQILNNLGNVYLNQKRWDEATDSCHQSLSIYREFKNKLGQGQTHDTLGHIYLEQGRWDEAIKAYQQSLNIDRQLKYRSGEGKTLYNIAMVYVSKGDKTMALANARDSAACFAMTVSQSYLEVAKNMVAYLERELSGGA